MEYNARPGFKSRALAFYEKNEVRIDIAFFLGGFLFDIATLPAMDDLFGILQQVGYLALVGAILFGELVLEAHARMLPRWFERIWNYRSAAVHFFLGSLFSIYSLFFLKSSSFFSSVIFVVFLMAVMVANELKGVRERGVDVKMALYILCVFCFFSICFPVLLGSVGWLPFFLSLVASVAVLLRAGNT